MELQMQNNVPQDDKKVKSAFRESTEITLSYFILAYAYIWFSDWLISKYVLDPSTAQMIQSIKVFISLGLIGLVYYIIVYRKVKKYLSNNEQLKKVLFELEYQNKQLAILEEKHFNLAYFDALTGLINRNRLEIRINRLIQNKTPFALLYLDIDDFGAINELDRKSVV